jgi:hypothetical protein
MKMDWLDWLDSYHDELIISVLALTVIWYFLQ